MTHADPWDEISRLEEQVEAELLARLEVPPPTEPNVRKRAKKTPGSAPDTVGVQVIPAPRDVLPNASRL